MTYKDLVFSCVASTPNGDVMQALVRFDNGLGLSVITGPGTLTSIDRPYEAAVISFSKDGTYKIIYPDFTHNDVLSYLTGDQLTGYLLKVSCYSQIILLL